MVDDYSRMTWMFLLKLKSDVCVVLYDFLVHVKIQFNKQVKCVRSDNEAKFVNSICDTLFKRLGIVHQRFCVYNPQ